MQKWLVWEHAFRKVPWSWRHRVNWVLLGHHDVTAASKTTSCSRSSLLAWRQPSESMMTSLWPGFSLWPRSTYHDVMAQIPRVTFFNRCPTLRGCRLKSTQCRAMKLCQITDNGLLRSFINFLIGNRPCRTPNVDVFHKMSTTAKTEHQSRPVWYTGCIPPKCHPPMTELHKVYIT